MSAIIWISSANACTFINLPITPLSPEKIDTFLGITEIIDVRFNNEKTEGNIEVFPDSPLIITNRKTNSACSIDGGVWVRKDIYVSDDSTVILAHEFSGSNDFLTFYDARDCKKIGEIDISNSVWRVGKLNISVTNQKAANNKKVLKPRMYSLTKYCTQKN
jgi:hypothetical protein